MPVKIFSRYNTEAAVLPRPRISFDPKKKADQSMTNQADMDAADINKIMARYEKTGVLVDPSGVERKPTYGDFTEIKNYHQMLCSIRNVERSFNLLPAQTRNRFDNDPQKLIDFLEDPKNDKEAVKLGFKNADVLLTALADDGVTRISAEARAILDKKAADARAILDKKAADAAASAAGASGTGTVK